MISESQFKVLLAMTENNNLSQREIAEAVKLSVGTVNSVAKGLRSRGLIAERQVTKEGYAELEPYKVDNAIILAAGMAKRFVPFSYEIPKGLIRVNGEPLIERHIKQLRESGISEIIIVVGYMMEKFLYLRDKYNVKFVVNNEYKEKNTYSSIYAARDYLRRTLIICADNYCSHNMFSRYEYKSYYCSVYLPGIGYTERSIVTDKKGLVIDTHKPSCNEWILCGHSYWDNEFSRVFKRILEDYYQRPGIENYYWETIWSENLEACPLYIKKCSDKDILDFDSAEELEAYDSDYIKNNNIQIMENICDTLNCKPSDIHSFSVMETGLNNRSFIFSCKNRRYIYRHPGRNAYGVINRKQEALTQQKACELGIDRTLIRIDENSGWKISKYIEVTGEFDFSNKQHVMSLAHHLKMLHQANVTTGYTFSYMHEADRLIESIRREDIEAYNRVEAEKKIMEPISNELELDGWQVSLCHNDIYEPNLIVEDSRVELIDWEFAGDSDIGFDICKLFSLLNPDIEEYDTYLSMYYGRNTTNAEKKHLIGCAAIIYYYWFVWSVYASKNGTAISSYMLTWYDKMVRFRELYRQIDD